MLRQKIADLGWTVKDTKDGQKVTKTVKSFEVHGCRSRSRPRFGRLRVTGFWARTNEKARHGWDLWDQ